MAKKYQVVVFGKAGCPKCKMLNQRVDKLLEDPKWEDYEKKYLSLDAEEGLIEFCKAECINPQRVPALLVKEFSEESQSYRPVADRRTGDTERPFAHTRLYHLVGLQTDYTDVGRGVISPKMIETVLQEAQA